MKTYAHWLTPVHVIVFSNIFHTYIINCSLLLYYSLALQFSMLFPSHASRRFRTMIGFMRYLLVYSLTVSIMHSLNIHMHKIPTAAAVLQTYFFIKKHSSFWSESIALIIISSTRIFFLSSILQKRKRGFLVENWNSSP